MTNDDEAVQDLQAPKEKSIWVRKESNADMTQPRQPPNPPETPTPPPSGTTTNDPRASGPASLPGRYQDALRHIHTLETQNTRLYEDNCRLVNAVNMLNDRLAFLGAPQHAQLHRLTEMQEKLRASETNWVSTNRKYQELLESISTGSAQHYIAMELQAIRDAYASLDREYRLLGDKYLRLKAVVDTSHLALQQSHGAARGHIPAAHPELANSTQLRAYPHDRSRGITVSPTSVVPPGSFQPLVDQRGNHRRRSSESIMAQPPLRTGPARLTPLPTPSPTTPLVGGRISPPKGFPVHAPVPAESLPLPHHTQIFRDPRSFLGVSAVTQSQHPVEKGTSEQLKTPDQPRQRFGGNTDTDHNELVPCDNPAPPPSKSSPHSQKRPSSEPQTSISPGGEHKKPRIEEDVDRPIVIDVDTHPASKVLSPVASVDPHGDRKSPASGSDVRSYQDCVNLIFEKDADVENGVFCGLCLDRYEAKMIQEPPDVLIQPDIDSLVVHCMTMHPTVWDDLRRKA